MKTKFSLLALLFALTQSATFGQLTINGAAVTLSPNTVLYVDGNITIKSGGSLNNSAISDTVLTTGNFDNQVTTTGYTGDGVLSFIGTVNKTIKMSGSKIYELHLNKLAARNVTCLDKVTITKTLRWSADNKLITGDNEVQLEANALPVGHDRFRFVQISGALGKLTKLRMTGNFTFPVGLSTGNFNNRLFIAKNSNTLRPDLSVRVDATGMPATDFINVLWTVTAVSPLPGGLIMDYKPFWLATQNQPTFSKTNCTVAHIPTGGGTWLFNTCGAASGSGNTTNPYFKTSTGYTTVGQISMADASCFTGAPNDRDDFALDNDATLAGTGNVEIWPNPATSVTNILFTHADPNLTATYAIFDMSGRRVMEQTINSGISEEIDLAQLATGTYIVRISTRDGQLATQKLVKID